MTSQTNGITRKYMYVGDIGGLKPEQRWTANKMIENQVFRRTTILDLAFNQIGSSYKPKDAWEKMKEHDDILYASTSKRSLSRKKVLEIQKNNR